MSSPRSPLLTASASRSTSAIDRLGTSSWVCFVSTMFDSLQVGGELECRGRGWHKHPRPFRLADAVPLGHARVESLPLGLFVGFRLFVQIVGVEGVRKG